MPEVAVRAWRTAASACGDGAGVYPTSLITVISENGQPPADDRLIGSVPLEFVPGTRPGLQ